MKHLISVSALILSAAACSSDPGTNGGSSGASNTTAGAPGSAGTPSGSAGSGVAGSPAAGSGGGGTTAGSGNTAGSAPTAGTSSGGTSSGGTSSGGTSAAGAPPTGGAASFKCDNLSLAPTATGVAKPAGAAGGLKVLDWAGFKGAASFTFDDNRPSQLPNYNAMKATGAHFTWFLIASSADKNGYKATIADGQEIANHTQTHPQNMYTQAEVTNAQTTLKTNFGVDVHSMAAPNCKDEWKPFAAPAKLFQNRGPCGGGTVSPRGTTDPFSLPAYMPPTNASSTDMTGQLAMGKWVIYVIHGFDLNDASTWQPVAIANVTAAMSKSVSDGYWTEGMTNVGAYWQGQKLIPATATTSATWTLPANFPPNMCVRITTTGGTVTQKGTAIAWDPHGYYQISLDAGEVTVN